MTGDGDAAYVLGFLAGLITAVINGRPTALGVVVTPIILVLVIAVMKWLGSKWRKHGRADG